MAEAHAAKIRHSEGMPYRETLPDARLNGLVRRFWRVEERHTPGTQEHRLMPESTVNLTFQTGESWFGSLDGTPLVRLPEATLSGLNLMPQRMVSPGWQRAMGADLYPWAARHLFGWTPGGPDLDLLARHPWPTRDICAMMREGDWNGAQHLLEHWLIQLWLRQEREPGKGVQAAHHLYASLGVTRISALAATLNISPRQLERLFAQEVGVNAKTLARLIRFQEIYHRLRHDPAQPLAALAYDLNFADQAHLTREFRALSHLTPGAFASFAAQRRDDPPGPGFTEP